MNTNFLPKVKKGDILRIKIINEEWSTVIILCVEKNTDMMLYNITLKRRYTFKVKQMFYNQPSNHIVKLFQDGKEVKYETVDELPY